MIWLGDQIAKHTLLEHSPDATLTLNDKGFAEELGSPFERIADVRLDVLAQCLYCDAGPPESFRRPTRRRAGRARDILAAVAGVGEHECDEYRPDLFDATRSPSSLSPRSRVRNLIHHGDLERTFFSLILFNNRLESWIRSLLDPSDRPVDPFRQLQQRVECILFCLDRYSEALRDPAPGTAHQAADAEGPRDVAWAATQITRCVARIRALVSRDDRPLEGWEKASAARALMRILRAVVERNFDAHPGATPDDRNLYQRLIGNNQDADFVYDALDLLPDQSQFVEELDDIIDRMGVNGVREGYKNKMSGLLARLRSSASSSSRRASAPAMPPPAGPGSAGGPSRSGSKRGRGGGGGGGSAAGTKRQAQGQDPRAKRVR
jgi:hypothetical protein